MNSPALQLQTSQTPVGFCKLSVRACIDELFRRRKESRHQIISIIAQQGALPIRDIKKEAKTIWAKEVFHPSRYNMEVNFLVDRGYLCTTERMIARNQPYYDLSFECALVCIATGIPINPLLHRSKNSILEFEARLLEAGIAMDFVNAWITEGVKNAMANLSFDLNLSRYELKEKYLLKNFAPTLLERLGLADVTSRMRWEERLEMNPEAYELRGKICKVVRMRDIYPHFLDAFITMFTNFVKTGDMLSDLLGGSLSQSDLRRLEEERGLSHQDVHYVFPWIDIGVDV